MFLHALVRRPKPPTQSLPSHLSFSKFSMVRMPPIALLVSVIAAGCSSLSPAGTTVAPMGILGPRIGTYLRIEGVRAEHGKVGSHSLLVQKVGDVMLPTPVCIWVENMEFPTGVRCVIRGFETGRWIGLPPEVERAEGLPARQAGWQFQHYFVATSVQEPLDLAKRFKADLPST